MSLILRLVGNFIDEYNKSFMYELKINNIKLINYNSIKSHLISLGDLEEEKFEFISMTYDGKNLNFNSFENINDDEKRVWLFCAKKEIRQEIIDIFESNGYKFTMNINIQNKSESLDSDDSDDSDDLEMSNNIVEQKILPDSINVDDVNHETIKLFEEPDFVKLFQIYLHKPVLFKKFYMYISNGNIPNNLEMTNNSNNEDNQLFIRNLELGFTDEQISEALIKTNNHLNFSIRYLLFKKYEN